MTTEIDETTDIGPERRSRCDDSLIVAVASRQHSVVGHGQLTDLGIGEGAIKHRLRCGRLYLVHRGVYAVGGRRLTRDGRWWAALIALGPGAVLSHRAAAALWGLRRSEGVDVTVPGDRRAPSGVVVHRSVLPPDEVAERAGFPVTTVARTIVDLAAIRPLHEVRKAVDEAERLRLGDTLSLADVVARYPGKRGIRKVRAILAEGRIGADVTREELEERFLRFIRRSKLPRPRTNQLVDTARRTYECDCVWQQQRLIVELDGYASHGTRRAYESDRERDRALSVAGWRTVRITWRQLHDDPEAVRRDLEALLAPPRSTKRLP